MIRTRSIFAAGRKLVPLAAALALLAACGNDPAADAPELDRLFKGAGDSADSAGPNKIVLRLWSFHQAKEFEFWQQLAQQYHELHPEIEIKVEYISSDDYFTGDRLLAAYASGQGPDLFFVSSPMIKRLVDVNMLLPLTSYFSKELREDYDPAALGSVTLDNDIYAVPIETELLGLFYNKTMFAEHHLQPPRTWDEMLADAKQLKTSKVSGLTVETTNGVYQNFSWLPFLWQTGADVVTEDAAASGLSGGKGEAFYSYFRGMVDQGLINMQPSRPATDIGILADGETAMQVTGTWNIRLLETEYADKAVGVVPLPTPTGADPLTIAGGWKIAVNRQSQYTDEAVKFIMWAFNGDTSIPLRWSSEVKFAYAPRSSVMEAGSDYYRVGLRTVFTDRIYGTERTEPQFSEEVNRTFSESIQSLLYGHMTGKQIADNTDKELTALLSGTQK